MGRLEEPTAGNKGTSARTARLALELLAVVLTGAPALVTIGQHAQEIDAGSRQGMFPTPMAALIRMPFHVNSGEG